MEDRIARRNYEFIVFIILVVLFCLVLGIWTLTGMISKTNSESKNYTDKKAINPSTAVLLVCQDCLDSEQIRDIYLFNTGDIAEGPYNFSEIVQFDKNISINDSIMANLTFFRILNVSEKATINNLSVLNNVSALYYYGSGKYLTDINGSENQTNNSRTFYPLNFNPAEYVNLSGDMYTNQSGGILNVNLSAFDERYGLGDLYYYFYNISSTVAAGYTIMNATSPLNYGANETKFVNVPNGTVLFERINENTNLTSLNKGLAFLHNHIKKSAGTRELRIMGQLYHRLSDGTELLICSSEMSPKLSIGIVAITDLHCDIIEIYPLNVTDYIVWKLIAIVTGSGNDPDISIYTMGMYGSGISLPVSISAFVFGNGVIMDYTNVSLYNQTGNFIEAQNFSNITTSDSIFLRNISTTPSNPPDNFLRFYARDDGTGQLLPYVLDPNGIETSMTANFSAVIRNATDSLDGRMSHLNYSALTKVWNNVTFYAQNVSINWTRLSEISWSGSNGSLITALNANQSVQIGNATLNSALTNATLFYKNVSLNQTRLFEVSWSTSNGSLITAINANWSNKGFNTIGYLNGSNYNGTGYGQFRSLNISGAISDVYLSGGGDPTIGTTYGSDAYIELYDSSTGEMTFKNNGLYRFIFDGGLLTSFKGFNGTNFNNTGFSYFGASAGTANISATSASGSNFTRINVQNEINATKANTTIINSAIYSVNGTINWTQTASGSILWNGRGNITMNRSGFYFQ